MINLFIHPPISGTESPELGYDMKVIALHQKGLEKATISPKFLSALRRIALDCNATVGGRTRP